MYCRLAHTDPLTHLPACMLVCGKDNSPPLGDVGGDTVHNCLGRLSELGTCVQPRLQDEATSAAIGWAVQEVERKTGLTDLGYEDTKLEDDEEEETDILDPLR